MGSVKKQIEAQYSEPAPTTLDRMPEGTRDNVLSRIAACVPVLVEAGCECIGHPVILWEDGPRVDGYADPERVIPHFKAWFRETVAPHFSPSMYELDPPFRVDGEEGWFWNVNEKSGHDPDPTDAFVQCLEALCEVVKQSKNEGGE